MPRICILDFHFDDDRVIMNSSEITDPRQRE
jgi:hypothetical protein